MRILDINDLYIQLQWCITFSLEILRFKGIEIEIFTCGPQEFGMKKSLKMLCIVSTSVMCCIHLPHMTQS